MFFVGASQSKLASVMEKLDIDCLLPPTLVYVNPLTVTNAQRYSASFALVARLTNINNNCDLNEKGISTPCAGGSGYPKLFYCRYTGSRGIAVVGPLSAASWEVGVSTQ